MAGEWRRKDRDEKSKTNLARPEAKIFYAMVKEARGNKRALAGVSVAQDELGLPTSWLRERVAGRIRVKPVDLEVLQRLINIAKSRVYHSGITPEEASARRRENAKPSAELADEPSVVCVESASGATVGIKTRISNARTDLARCVRSLRLNSPRSRS